jgi:hypothetical protein
MEYHPLVVAQPVTVTSIAAKRRWIFEHCTDRSLVMLDDDMGFYARGPKGLLKEYATEAVIEEAFAWMEHNLGRGLAHMGLSSRMGNNHVEEQIKNTTRMMHALAYDTKIARKEIEFERVAMREDFDYTLQLLRKGYDNAVRYDICVAPGSYGAKGGCSDERTVAKSDAEAVKLAALHPGLVKVVDRNYKGIPRKEVVVQWKKAFRFDC